MSTIELLLLSNVVLAITILYCIYRVECYRRVFNMLRKYTELTPKDPIPFDPDLISEWMARRKSLPEGGAKWLAYSNRLVDAGILKRV